jgi:hypothetical protein
MTALKEGPLTETEFADLSEEERNERRLWRTIGLVIRMRALGASWRVIAESFGGSKTWWGRQAPILDGLVSQLGQSGWQNPRRVKEALSQLGQDSFARWRQMQEAAPPDGDKALADGLAALGRLLNYDPVELVDAMTPESRTEARRLAPLVSAWLAAVEEAP